MISRRSTLWLLAIAACAAALALAIDVGGARAYGTPIGWAFYAIVFPWLATLAWTTWRREETRSAPEPPAARR